MWIFFVTRLSLEQDGTKRLSLTSVLRSFVGVVFFIMVLGGCSAPALPKPVAPPISVEPSMPAPGEPRMPAPVEPRETGDEVVALEEEVPAFSGYIRLSDHDKSAMLAQLSMQQQKLGSWKDLQPSLERSLAYLRRKPADKPAIQAEGLHCTWGDLEATVQELLELLPELDVTPEVLGDHFDWYMHSPSTLMTGYYEPLIHASFAPCPEYPFPLYGMPRDLKIADLGAFHPRWKGEKLIYRIEDGKIRPYHTRKELDSDRVLDEQGIEIAWVRDLVDIFFLQIQGSGRLVFPDGTVRHVLYAGKNGRKYVSLGKILIQKGYMSADQMSMQGIRIFLKNRPALVEKLLNTNPSYVFFRLASDGPYGAMGAVLTPLVSVASDPSSIPLGTVLVHRVTLPSAKKEADPVVLFGLAQDRGGAIKGDHLDLFCGAGEVAAFLAGHMKEEANVCVLLRTKKNPNTND